MRSTPLKAILRTAALAGAGVLLAAGVSSAAVTVYLQATSVTKTLPAGVEAPMWVFVCDPAHATENPNCVPSTAGSPMPRIIAAAGEALTIVVSNTLPTPVSIMIPGQAGGGIPVFTGGRVQSLTNETGAGTVLAPGTGTYTWSALRAGTYLYQSGTHPSIQVPMGLYGALVVGDYSGVDAEAVLLFSEIDYWQNRRVADAAAASLPLTTACVKVADYVPTVGSPVGSPAGSPVGYPCTVDYTPAYFLINGAPYDKAAPPPAVSVGLGGNVLLRLLNAGLRSHTPAIVGLNMGLIAEDGNRYPGLVRQQASTLLPAGKTIDVLVAMPRFQSDGITQANATYPLFDRMLDLSNYNEPDGGMLVYLQVGTGSTPPPVTGKAVNDIYTVPEDAAPYPGASVLSNDATLTNAVVVSGPSNGTLSLNADGTFSYTPNPNFSGADGFTYTASDGTNTYGAQVTLNVSFVNDAPVAAADAYVSSVGGSITVDAAHGVLGNDADPDGDTLTAVVVGGGVALNADGSFTYTGGSGSFQYIACDRPLVSGACPAGFASDPVTVTLTVNPASGITLTVQEPGGAAVTAYRWLVQEDATFHNNVSAPPPVIEMQSFTFHKSYMPVVAQGSGAAAFAQFARNPAKYYYVSVLPDDAGTGAGHTIGGAPIPPGTSAVTVIVNTQPIPTAQISILVFDDRSPTNGVPDALEPGLGGFQITLEDAGGRYGISGGTMSQDAFGNPLRNSLACAPASTAGGAILTCPDGTALIKDLPPGKYGVIAVAPAGTGRWTQTATIEGTKVIDTWVKAGEPPYFVEAGAPGFHAFIGFVNPDNLGNPGGSRTITGSVTLLHDPRPPGAPGTVDSGSYAGLSHTRAWIGLNTIGGDGPNIATVQADADGKFTLSGIPDGTHQLVIWDTYLDQVIAYRVVNLPADAGNIGNIPVNAWFTRLEHNVFLDTNGNGKLDDGEPGLPEQAVNLRFRDGSVFQTFPTDTTGFVPFDQVFPFFSWQVAEVDYTRFKPTGVTVTVDGGGPVDASGILNPQAGSPRTETGPVLTQAFQGFPGQTSIFDWGKQPYAPGENGGISGIVFYGSTRGENDPRLTVGDPWEPGIPGVKVRLHREVATSTGGKALAFVQEVLTDSWDAALPTNCPGENPADPFTIKTLGIANLTQCYDGWRNWNQIRPGVFDGGYAFNNIPPGKYVVEVVPPPGYELIKEEDKNVDFGDAFETAPAAVMLPGGAIVAAMPDLATILAATGPEPGLAQPACVGADHLVPGALSLFPGELAPFAGATRPLCDRKEVVLSDQGQAAADFHLFTSTPVAAQFSGLITDDIASETNPAAPGFGEKWSPAYLPFSIRDFKGQEVYRGYSDAFGRYNGVLPSTFSANIPIPSGYSPAMMAACLNDPGPLPGGGLDPLRNQGYGIFCYTMQFMPGTTTYLDTPILPTTAFAAGFNPPDCAAPAGTPVIASVDAQGGATGPLVAPGGTLVIRSMGQNAQVPNPAYEGPLAAAPFNQPTIARDLGFGAGGPGGSTQGTVTLGGTPLVIETWNANTIRATLPAGATTGQLVVTRSNGNVSVNAVTVTVGTETPIRVSAGGSIQAAIDGAAPGSLILVDPGTYQELVVMWKPVRLQGSGAATIINAVKRPVEKLAAWSQKVQSLVDAGTVDLLPGQPNAAALVGPGLFGTELGAGVTVLAKNDPLNTTGGSFLSGTNPSRIDGFTITGADSGGGIFVNGYAHNLEISNNHVTGNSGTLHGGIRVGHPFLPGLVPNAAGLFGFNRNLNIHHNAVTLNGGLHFESAGGGVSLSTGTDNYTFSRNFVCGNYTQGDGAGIGHLGLSTPGRIEFNQVLFNQSVNQGMNQHGGGIFIAGEPAATPALTLGAGNVTLDANLVQGNQAGSGHGGGIRTQYVNGTDAAGTDPWRVTLTNNMIVNNVAAWSGAGVSLQDTTTASIVNNTIAGNDSTATVGGLIDATGTSQAQPAGISSERHSPNLAAAIAGPGFSNPALVNNIVWQNRAFSYGLGQLQPVVTPASVGGCAGGNYWDLGVLGELPASSVRLSPTSSILTDTAGYDGSNLSGAPAFLSAYCNGARTLSAAGPMLATAAFGEGGNFIDVRYGPLTQAWPAANAPWNYHVGAASAGLDNGNSTVAPNRDFDNQVRPQGSGVDRGADEVAVAAPTPGTVTLSATFTSPAGASLTATNLNFGNKTGLVSSTVTFTVGGGTPVLFATAAVTNGTPAAFTKGADTCSGNTVPVGGTCSITVTFNAPGGNNARTGVLTVPHNGVGNPTTRTLSGS